MGDIVFTADGIALANGPWAEISLSNLTHNLNLLKQMIPAGVRIVPVVKANAYGHGMVTIASHLQQIGIDGLCVATASEGSTLREAGISIPIFVLSSLSETDVPMVVDYGLTPAITSYEVAQVLNKLASSLGQLIDVHVRIDVGLGSMGIPYSSAETELKKILSLPSLDVTGIFTQLAAAYSNDRALLEEQIARFEQILVTARQLGVTAEFVHAASSPAIISGAPVHYNMVRPGILLYGLPFSNDQPSGLKMVMSIKTRVIEVNTLPGGETLGYKQDTILTRATTLASLAFGYADAMYLHFGCDLDVLIRGQRASVVGHAYMDHIVVDVTNISGIMSGDEAILLGKQGDEEITPEELTDKTGIGIANSDCLTLLSDRVRRLYLGLPDRMTREAST